MQNFDGSWAQGCSRKHALMPAPTQPAACCSTTAAAQGQTQSASAHVFDPSQNLGTAGLQNENDPTLSQEFNVDDFKMPDGTQPMDINDILMNDLEQPAHGCCCGGRR